MTKKLFEIKLRDKLCSFKVLLMGIKDSWESGLLSN